MKLVLANNTWQRHKHVTACDHAVGFVTKSLFISINSITYLASKGWQSGESICFPPMWPGFKSRRQRHMWVEFVVGSLPCSERFFSGYSGFPLSSKPNISKLQFNQESGRRRTTLWMCYLQISIIIIITSLSIHCNLRATNSNLGSQ